MKQIRHTLINSEKPMDQEEFSQKLEHLFEWANKVGREGRLVSHLDVQPSIVTCIEYVTDDDYMIMLKSGKITENKPDDKKEEAEKAPEQEAHPSERAPAEKEGIQDTSIGDN